jgi:hypothetical protein
MEEIKKQEDPDVESRLILKFILQERDWEDVDWIHLAQGIDGGGLLSARELNFVFHNMRRISRMTKQLRASQAFCSSR